MFDEVSLFDTFALIVLRLAELKSTRHVVVPALVEANAVAMRQPEDVGDHLSVDEVLGADARTHQIKATSVDGSVRRGR